MRLWAAMAVLQCVSAAASADTVAVYLHDYAFSTDPNPAAPFLNTVTVNVGDTVRWQWVANFHNVVHVGGAGGGTLFRSPLQDATSAVPYTFTFTQPGEYTYICEIHGSFAGGVPNGMWGRVTVVPGPAGGALAAAAGVLLAARRRR